MTDMAKAPELRGEELEAFAKKVERLQAEGLTLSLISERLGVVRSTLDNRMTRYRRLQREEKPAP